MGYFLKRPFVNMLNSAKAQHAVDKANLEAHKAEAKAQWEEAKMTPKQRQAMLKEERAKQKAEAKARKEAARERRRRIKASPEARKELKREEQAAEIAKAKARIDAADERYTYARDHKFDR